MPIDPTAPYDDDNIFAKILRGEIPSSKIYEDEWAIAFEDINPQAEIHTLVVPKGRYVSWDDFSAQAPDEEIAGFAVEAEPPGVAQAVRPDLPTHRLAYKGVRGRDRKGRAAIHIDAQKLSEQRR